MPMLTFKSPINLIFEQFNDKENYKNNRKNNKQWPEGFPNYKCQYQSAKYCKENSLKHFLMFPPYDTNKN